MLSPRQIFEDNTRPAELLLRVFRLLEHDAPNTEADLGRSLRDLVKADKNEGLTVIYNEIFLGLIRERAQLPQAAIRRPALLNLLRQAVVIACTGLETYLPAVMSRHFEELIELKGRSFLATNDREVKSHLESVRFNIDEALQLLEKPTPLLVANKVKLYLDTNLSGSRGVKVLGVLFGVEDPWGAIGQILGRKPTELAKFIEEITSRRNDIVHRADRSKKDPGGDAQPIAPGFAMQAVETIRCVVHTLDDLVQDQLKELRGAVNKPTDEA